VRPPARAAASRARPAASRGQTAALPAGADGGAAGAAGGAAGAAGGGAAGAAGTTDGGMDTKTDGSADAADVAPTPCVSGGTCSDPAFTCSIARTCRRNQEQFCFCAPNNKIACEPCDTTDAGTDASGDASTDASGDASGDASDAGNTLDPCPANASNPATTCDVNGDRCAQGACNTNNHRQQVCVCVVFNGNTGRYFCGLSAMCQ
jgi:hypothetical protein